MEYPLSYDALAAFIASGVRETRNLVFLEAAVMLRDARMPEKLAQIVAALANEGAAVVYCGVSAKRGRAHAIQSLVPSGTNDWLLHEIQALVQPRIEGMNLQSIEIPDGGVVYRIEIPEHNNRPHMSSDLRYYRWYKRRCAAMEEPEVRMLYGISASPDIDYVGLYNTNGLPVLAEGFVKTISFYPKLLVQNRGGALEKDYKIEVLLPTVLHDVNFIPLQSKLVRHEGIYSVFSVSGNAPLYQDEVANPLEVKILVNSENFGVFCSEQLIVKVYYSKGVRTHSLKLADTFTYNGRVLSTKDLSDGKSIQQTNLFS